MFQIKVKLLPYFASRRRRHMLSRFSLAQWLAKRGADPETIGSTWGSPPPTLTPFWAVILTLLAQNRLATI